MRLSVCLFAFAIFSIVSAPSVLADPIYNFDLHPHSVILSSTISASTHADHDSLIFTNSLLSREPFFSAGPSSYTSFGREDHSVHADLLGDKPNYGFHFGWWSGVEHRHHHHYGGTTDGNNDPPSDPVAVPEPSATAFLTSGLVVVLFCGSRKRACA